jgi:cytochrome c oxidase subunit 2
MLFDLGALIFVLVWVLLAYILLSFRDRRGESGEPAVSPGSTPILLVWAGVSFAIVMFLAGWGTITLRAMTAPPGVSGAAAHSSMHGSTTGGARVEPMIIQVIARQWLWTFRYPSYGGMVTRYLVVPYNIPIRFHITSVDVVHSLWIYDYDIKEDAIPGLDNTAWFLARRYDSSPGAARYGVRCNELCGIGHSTMVTGLYVKSRAAFVAWARTEERRERSSGLLRRLPRYSATYNPLPRIIWPKPPQY